MTRPAAGTQIPIPVTAGHIATGRPCDPFGDAVALAALDAVPGAETVVSCYAEPPEHAYVRVWVSPSAWLRLVLGPDGRDLMRALDGGHRAGPCTLTGVVA